MGRPNKNNRNRNRNNNESNRPQQTPLNTEPARRPVYTKQSNVVDYLSEDEEISSQRYVCVSFASITNDMKNEFVEDIAGQTNVPKETVETIVNKWCEKEHPKRAVKIRGSAGSTEEILKRAEKVRSMDENFHIFTCEVGKWLCFDPDPEMVEDENYMESQLNELVKGYKQNKLKTKVFFEQRQRELMEKAIAEGTPEGQKIKMMETEPVQAVQQRAEQADAYIKELEDKINEAKLTKELAKRKLEVLENKNNDLESQKTIGKLVEELNEDKLKGIDSTTKAAVDTLREMQQQAKQAELSDLAQELGNRSQAQREAALREQLASSQYEEMNQDVLIPSQIRYNYTDKQKDQTRDL